MMVKECIMGEKRWDTTNQRSWLDGERGVRGERWSKKEKGGEELGRSGHFRTLTQSLAVQFYRSMSLLEVDYVLTADLPSNPLATIPAPSDLESSRGPPVIAADQVKKDQVKKNQVTDPEKYAKDKIILGHLLNHISDPMFDLLVAKKFANDIWSTLKSRYGGDDARLKKYIVGKWL
ncbi:ty1-copia retrotransposon protein [Cucumis melo var. makuwa]|nr:ty1-copia retrotransposon protein [Cucumis melo var. makuwa]